MGDFSGWAKYLRHLLVLVGFVMSILYSSLKLFSENRSTDPMVLAGFTVLLVLSVIIVVSVLVLAFKEKKNESSSKGVVDSSAGGGEVVVHSEGGNSPAISAEVVNITYTTSAEALEQLKDKDKVIQRLKTTLEEKNVALDEREQITKDWVTKYKELEESLEARDENDSFAVCAREKLDEGDFDGAVECLKQSFESNMAGAEEQLRAAAADAYEIAELKVLKLEYHEALLYYEQAVSLDLKNSKHLNKYGTNLYTLGEYKKAIRCFEEALEIDKATYGEKHPDVAIRLNNIGNAWNALNEPRKAIEYHEQALNIDRYAYGDKHPNIAIRFNNIGGALDALGEHEKALGYFEQALEIVKAAYGDEHPYMAATFNNIGSVWSFLEKHKKALGYFEQALEIWINSYGKKHPQVATALNNIGTAWDNIGEPDKAKMHYKQALEIILNSYGEDHPKANDLKEKLDNLSRLG